MQPLTGGSWLAASIECSARRRAWPSMGAEGGDTGGDANGWQPSIECRDRRRAGPSMGWIGDRHRRAEGGDISSDDSFCFFLYDQKLSMGWGSSRGGIFLDDEKLWWGGGLAEEVHGSFCFFLYDQKLSIGWGSSGGGNLAWDVRIVFTPGCDVAYYVPWMFNVPLVNLRGRDISSHYLSQSYRVNIVCDHNTIHSIRTSVTKKLQLLHDLQ